MEHIDCILNKLHPMLIVHHNYNEIYPCVSWKTFVHTCIDERKCISLQRHQNFNNLGRILMANKIAYWNGCTGINNHGGDNTVFN